MCCTKCTMCIIYQFPISRWRCILYWLVHSFRLFIVSHIGHLQAIKHFKMHTYRRWYVNTIARHFEFVNIDVIHRQFELKYINYLSLWINHIVRQYTHTPMMIAISKAIWHTAHRCHVLTANISLVFIVHMRIVPCMQR